MAPSHQCPRSSQCSKKPQRASPCQIKHPFLQTAATRKAPGLRSLCSLGCLGGKTELSAKDCIPEAARDAKAVLVICEMVLEVVFLELPVEGWEPM